MACTVQALLNARVCRYVGRVTSSAFNKQMALCGALVHITEENGVDVRRALVIYAQCSWAEAQCLP
jgi:hypothetical protein